jgi:hypothetical protein
LWSYISLPCRPKMPRSKETYTRIPYYGKISFFEAELWQIIVFWRRNYNNLCKGGGIITTYQLLVLAELWKHKVAELWELPHWRDFCVPGKLIIADRSSCGVLRLIVVAADGFGIIDKISEDHRRGTSYPLKAGLGRVWHQYTTNAIVGSILGIDDVLDAFDEIIIGFTIDICL